MLTPSTRCTLFNCLRLIALTFCLLTGAVHAQNTSDAAIENLFNAPTIWRGRADLWIQTMWYPQVAYQLTLRARSGQNVEGILDQRFGLGHRQFRVEGKIVNGKFRGRTLSYSDIQPLDREPTPLRARPNLAQCDRYELEGTLQTSGLVWFSPQDKQRGELGLDGPQMDLDIGMDGICGVRPRLIRQSDSIVAFVGGFNDSSVRDRVYPNYLAATPPGQAVKYFRARENGNIINYLVRELRANPFARIALVGHSWGGDTVLNVAEDLLTNFSHVRLDLVITLDPVRQLDGTPSRPLIPGRRRTTPAMTLGKIDRPKPSNVLKWLNVFIDPNDRTVSSEGCLTSAGFFTQGSGHYSIQRAADFNYLLRVNHCQPDLMFSHTLEPLSRSLESMVRELHQPNLGWINLKYQTPILADIDKHYLGTLSPAERDRRDSEQNPEELDRAPNSEDLERMQLSAVNEWIPPDEVRRPGEEAFTFEISSAQKTSIRVRPGDQLRVYANGLIDLNQFAGETTPEGVNGLRGESYTPAFRRGAFLLGIEYANGKEGWVMCGAGCFQSYTQPGTVLLRVNDKEGGDNTGTFKITLLLKRGAAHP